MCHFRQTNTHKGRKLNWIPIHSVHHCGGYNSALRLLFDSLWYVSIVSCFSSCPFVFPRFCHILVEQELWTFFKRFFFLSFYIRFKWAINFISNGFLFPHSQGSNSSESLSLVKEGVANISVKSYSMFKSGTIRMFQRLLSFNYDQVTMWTKFALEKLSKLSCIHFYSIHVYFISERENIALSCNFLFYSAIGYTRIIIFKECFLFSVIKFFFINEEFSALVQMNLSGNLYNVICIFIPNILHDLMFGHKNDGKILACEEKESKHWIFGHTINNQIMVYVYHRCLHNLMTKFFKHFCAVHTTSKMGSPGHRSNLISSLNTVIIMVGIGFYFLFPQPQIANARIILFHLVSSHLVFKICVNLVVAFWRKCMEK